jgi:hypothetical protein
MFIFQNLRVFSAMKIQDIVNPTNQQNHQIGMSNLVSGTPTQTNLHMLVCLSILRPNSASIRNTRTESNKFQFWVRHWCLTITTNESSSSFQQVKMVHRASAATGLQASLLTWMSSSTTEKCYHDLLYLHIQTTIHETKLTPILLLKPK